MISDADPLPDGVLEAMAYLSRSENRIRILHALTRRPFKPRELEEKTGIPRSTLRRIISEMVDRGWVDRTSNRDYVATPVGDLMAAETERYTNSVRAIQALGSAASWLPHDELTIDLHHFKDARTIGPEMNAAVAPDTYAIEQIRISTEFRNLTNIAPTLGFERAMHNGVMGGTLSSEHIITSGVITQLRTTDDRMGRWQRYLDAGAELFLYENDIPCNLFIMGELCLSPTKNSKLSNTLSGLSQSGTSHDVGRSRRAW